MESLLFHNFQVFWRVEFVDHDLDDVHWKPRNNSQCNYFHHEFPCDVASVEIFSEECNRQNVDEEGENRRDNHLGVDLVDLSVDVEELDNDEGGEGDGDDVGEGVVEENDGSEHDDAALEDGLEGPDEEGLAVQTSAFLEGLIERGELHDRLGVDVDVENEGEDGKRGVDGGVAEHEESIVDGDSDEEEDDREESLDDGDDEASVDDELAEHRRALVGKPTVPQEKSPQVLELVDREIGGERGLFALLPHNPDSHVCLQNHAYVVASVAH